MRNIGWTILASALAASCIHHADRSPETTDGVAAVGGGSVQPRGLPPRPSQTPPNRAPVPPGMRVGTVRAIGMDSRFVLLETVNPSGASSVVDGQQLRCIHADTADTFGPFAIVKVSRERRPPFIVADVLSGQPQAGDDVYAVKDGGASPSPASTPSATSFLLPAAARPAPSSTPR